MSWLRGIDFTGIGGLGGDDEPVIVVWTSDNCPNCTTLKNAYGDSYNGMKIEYHKEKNPFGKKLYPWVSIYKDGKHQDVQDTDSPSGDIVRLYQKYSSSTKKNEAPSPPTRAQLEPQKNCTGTDCKPISSKPSFSQDPLAWALSPSSSTPQSVSDWSDNFTTTKHAVKKASIWDSMNSLAKSGSGIVDSISAVVRPDPVAKTDKEIVATTLDPKKPGTPVKVDTTPQALAVAKNNAPSATPAAQLQAANIILSESRRGRTIYLNRKSPNALPWIIGIGALGAVALIVIASKAGD